MERVFREEMEKAVKELIQEELRPAYRELVEAMKKELGQKRVKELLKEEERKLKRLQKELAAAQDLPEQAKQLIGNMLGSIMQLVEATQRGGDTDRAIDDSLFRLMSPFIEGGVQAFRQQLAAQNKRPT